MNGIIVGAGVDEPKVVELQRLQGAVQRFGHLGSFTECEIDSEASAAVEEEKVEFGDAVSGPEVCFGWFQDTQGLLQGKTLP